jgi:hypothetical protein
MGAKRLARQWSIYDLILISQFPEFRGVAGSREKGNRISGTCDIYRKFDPHRLYRYLLGSEPSERAISGRIGQEIPVVVRSK